MKATLARKIGMTQVYTEDGAAVPATLLDLSSARVLRSLPNSDNKIEIGIGAKKNTNKAEQGIYGDQVPAAKLVIEHEGEAETNAAITVEIFSTGDKVNVTGITKGKGFQGFIKRWGFHGGPNTHGGQSGKRRSPGSIGPGTSHGRVFKGKKMSGHMGDVQRTIKNLKIVAVNPELNVVAVSGAIPGSKGSYVLINKQ